MAGLPCGCCDDGAPETPVAIENSPGLSAVGYRVGTHSSFKRAMHRALGGRAGLRGLTTRDDRDPALAAVDAWATALDVLTFYQERIANEGYLRTAIERRSMHELGAAIGYELRPATAATAFVAFAADTTPAAPAEVRLDPGTKVQSQPGQDETAQTFETVEAITARPAWNTPKPRLTVAHPPDTDSTEAWLSGATLDLKPGDLLLFVSGAGGATPAFALRRLIEVERDDKRSSTRVAWDAALPSGLGPSSSGVPPEVSVLRLRTALFGFNAVPFDALPVSLRLGEPKPPGAAAEVPLFIAGAFSTKRNVWADAATLSGTTLDLDAVYPTIASGSWLVLLSGAALQLRRVTGVAEVVADDFGLSAKVTRVTLAAAISGNAGGVTWTRRNTIALAQSEKLSLAEAPEASAIFGSLVAFDEPLPAFLPGQRIIVQGRAASGVVAAGSSLKLDNGTVLVLATESRVETVSAPVDVPGGGQAVRVRTADGVEGVLEGTAVLKWVISAETAPVVGELVEVLRDESVSGGRSQVRLTANLGFAFDRQSTTVYANVARATHGETRREVAGTGDASKPHQRFTLKQQPLTYLPTTTARGFEPALKVRVNGVQWSSVTTLFGQPPNAQVYVASEGADGKAVLQFGDGLAGARLPTGAENVSAAYRVGAGTGGRVKAGQLNLLLSRPLGLVGASNPLPAEGGSAPEPPEDARKNMPSTVLTLGRVVSVQDYEDFAAAYPGIGKALAVLLWQGERQVIHLTVAGEGGSVLAAGGDLLQRLRGSLDAARDLHQHLVLQPGVLVPFGVTVKVLRRPEYEFEPVAARAKAALTAAFAFDRRGFGEAVTRSAVVAAVQRVEGVEAALLVALSPAPLGERLEAGVPVYDGAVFRPAELLLVDPLRVEVQEMSREL